jgi:CheY-like chemotaxis protein/nitrogen-specific signal transduction histidine kinase
MEDISAERERQSVMDNARRAAEEMQVAQAQFMANISHELRTPITAVMGLTELLSETELSFDAHTYVEGISTAAERLLHFTSALLDAVDLTTGTLRLNESDVLVSSVLEAVRFFFGRRADSQRLRFEISATEDVARRVFRGDSERVRQVLVSLADNAVKFARARVEVSASLVSVDGELRLAFDVRNDGPAIPEDIAHQVFALFLQEDGSLTRSGGGAGLGLFVARQTARLMGGDLVLQQNSRDQGVSFRFTLPVLPVGSQTAKGGGQSDGERDGRRVRVLVAEDTELTQVMLRRMLEKHGHDVAVAKDGAEAVAVWRTWEPDLVLMDIQMPVMDGYAATHDIRKAEAGGGRRHTPIIAVTAHVLSRDRQKCLDAGMDDFLGKPFQGSDLLKLVERYTAEASRSTGKS